LVGCIRDPAPVGRKNAVPFAGGGAQEWLWLSWLGVLWVTHVERHGPPVGAGLRTTLRVNQPPAVGRERIRQHVVLTFQQLLRLARAVAPNPVDGRETG